MGGHQAPQAKLVKLCANPRDMYRKAVGARLTIDPPNLGKEPPFAQALSRCLRKPPQEFELSGMQIKPAILDTGIAMKQVERNITCFDEAWEHFIAAGPHAARIRRVHNFPPARIE
jgi:hypothetical protein